MACDDVLSDPLGATSFTGGIEVTEDEVTERLGVFSPVGRTWSVVVTAGMTGWRGRLKITARTAAEQSTLETLRATTHALRLQTCAGEDFHLRLLSPRPRRRVGGFGVLKWVHEWEFVETDAP